MANALSINLRRRVIDTADVGSMLPTGRATLHGKQRSLAASRLIDAVMPRARGSRG